MKKKYLICFGFFVCVCLLIVASFYDLQIDKMVYDKDNFYARFFDIFGEFPLYALIPFSLIIMFVYLKKSEKLWHLLLSGLCVFVSFVATCLCVERFFGELIPFRVVFTLSMSVIILLQFGLDKLSLESKEKLFKFALFALLYCVVILVVNQGVKLIWGRCRFLTMVESGNFDSFSNWWEIQGINGNKSFYSGHTTSAMALLCLIPLARLFHIEKNKYIALHALIYVFVVLVAVSRLVYGAHFLSDVIVAVIICGAIYLILYSLFGKKLFNTGNYQISMFDIVKFSKN